VILADQSAFDIRERYSDPDEIMETMKDAVRAQSRTSIPVSVVEDSEDGHTVRLQPLVKAIVRKPDGTTEAVQLPVLPDIPIHHSGGGGVTTTHAHKKGDEGWIVVSDASIDAWHQQGGVQAPPDTLSHAISDAVYLPGVRSDPRKLQGVSKASTQTRTDDKQSVHDVGDKGVTSVRGTSVVQATDDAARLQKNGASTIVDGMTIQNVAGKILMNC
jgi:hypothetical protein